LCLLRELMNYIWAVTDQSSPDRCYLGSWIKQLHVRVDIADYYVKFFACWLKLLCAQFWERFCFKISHLLTYLIFLAQMSCKRRGDFSIEINCLILWNFDCNSNPIIIFQLSFFLRRFGAFREGASSITWGRLSLFFWFPAPLFQYRRAHLFPSQ